MYTLSVMPNPIKLIRALLRPNRPFIMLNLLKFKERATGDYSHMTGQEAYMEYAKSVEVAQAPLGSRLLWSGNVQEQVGGNTAPQFDTVAVLEYASPLNFLRFATMGNSKTDARKAGLEGQWNLASTTLEFNPHPPITEESIVLVELLSDKSDEISKPANAHTIWQGRVDQHFIGTAKPSIQQVIITYVPKEQIQDVNHLAYRASTTKDGMSQLR